jgi:hypothetical protein
VTSAAEYQVWRHSCGVVIGAIEEHNTAKQDDRQQAVSKPGRPAQVTSVHLFPFPGQPALQLFVAVFASSVSTPAAQALANE